MIEPRLHSDTIRPDAIRRRVVAPFYFGLLLMAILAVGIGWI